MPPRWWFSLWGFLKLSRLGVDEIQLFRGLLSVLIVSLLCVAWERS